TAKRVGGEILPELLGVPAMEDIFRYSRRKTSPLEISRRETFQLLSILPFWAFRFLAVKAHKSPVKKVWKLVSQLRSHFYVMNETGGIAHTIPDHEKLLAKGTNGIISEISGHQDQTAAGSEKWHFYEAAKISADAFARLCKRYRTLAEDMAAVEPDPQARQNLEEIAACFKNIPENGANTFREALQLAYLAHIAIMIESLDNSIGLGRMDQFLYPYYKKDIESGRLTPEQAKELVAAFSIKMCELVPVFPQRVVNFHGGFYNAQVVTVGGVDKDGHDATNELTHIFLEVMNALRMREPNYHARLHAHMPAAYFDRVVFNLSTGANTPSLYNDDVIIETMCKNGYAPEDARNYANVGCVEPIAPGKTFASTNAAMVNVPLLLELAVNQGRRFGSPVRTGAKTPAASRMADIKDVTAAFETQLAWRVKKLIGDLQGLERANRVYHPTPFTSMLHEGCIASGRCTTAGGAVYNFSGIQAVAPSAVGDALYAIDRVVFKDRRMTLPELVRMLKKNIPDPKWAARLKQLQKYGNDYADVDQWTLYVADAFGRALEGYENTRGGKYVMGIYSDTIHEYFGRITGALPHGRRKGESFPSGISPGNGFDRQGPTALLNSANRFDFTTIPNGINFNLKFYPHTVSGEKGRALLSALLKTYFKQGGMQAQLNVIDPEELKKARDNPELYPNLVVRVSGYTVYFKDLAPAVQDEIIQRSTLAA
ncbi:MAG: pyruvate formate lyase family protein, partial [Thermodesulfobacteriota bacterium]